MTTNLNPIHEQITLAKAAAVRAGLDLTGAQAEKAAADILMLLEGDEDADEFGAFYDAAKEYFTR